VFEDTRTDAEFFLDCIQAGYLVWDANAKRWIFTGRDIKVYNEPTWESMIDRLSGFRLWRV
jgi:hypothetical protein